MLRAFTHHGVARRALVKDLAGRDDVVAKRRNRGAACIAAADPSRVRAVRGLGVGIASGSEVEVIPAAVQGVACCIAHGAARGVVPTVGQTCGVGSILGRARRSGRGAEAGTVGRCNGIRPSKAGEKGKRDLHGTSDMNVFAVFKLPIIGSLVAASGLVWCVAGAVRGVDRCTTQKPPHPRHTNTAKECFATKPRRCVSVIKLR